MRRHIVLDAGNEPVVTDVAPRTKGGEMRKGYISSFWSDPLPQSAQYFSLV